ncbi:probable cytochrome P450 6a14 [Chironomus tepperi]|uniref:probable cytochrome P450 6a14 n=1 Tax=Chironomus tepperi TaxID=113505 RepID=UPI00391F9D06
MILEVLIFIFSVISLFWLFFKMKFNYFKKLDIPHKQPRIPFGNMQGFKRKLHSSHYFRNLYEEFKRTSPFCGIYLFTKPSYLIIDLELVKSILVKDFAYFHDRGMYYNLKDDPLSGHLLNLEGEKWKKLREKLTPTFTSGKMRYMFKTIIDVAEKFETFMDKSIVENDEPEIKGILARFTTNIIGTCAFGIECNTFEEKDSKFLEMGLKAFEQPRNSFFKQMIAMTFPDFARKLGIKIVRDDVSDFFMKIVKDVIEYRESKNIKRNDFMDLLLQLKNEGKMSFEEIAAQAFVFFLAGFETSSTTMTFALHELSLNQKIQEEVRDNIKKVLQKYNGKITYEALSEMDVLERCINESLRKFPPAASLIRSVTKDYHVPNSKVILQKGATIFISVYGIHHDPEIYEDPENFNPDRFLPENVANRNSMSFLPFGQGNRICIGERFGYIETKVGLVTLLSKFKFEPSSKTKTPIEFSKKNMILTTEGGMFLKVKKIQTESETEFLE